MPKTSSVKKYIPKIIFLIFVFSFGFLIGRGDLANDRHPGYESVANKENIKITNQKEIDFDIFWDVWKLLEEKYTLKPLDYQKMVYGAISGMVNSLEDPYTVFLDPETSRQFNEDNKGSFEGIGAEIGVRDSFLTIIAPLKGSPAEKAGLLTGDKIVKIDDKEVVPGRFGVIDIDEAVRMIRGEKGTSVKLTVIRDGIDGFKEIEIVRDVINVKSVEWKMKDKGIVYLKISQFTRNTANELNKEIDEILINNPRGIVLDLRNNPGGYLDVAVDVASRFIPKGKTVVIEESKDEKEALVSLGGDRLGNLPVVVLVNEGSASASEILAGALRDDKGAKLVGAKTYGKGLVQELEELKNGSSLKVTVAKWLTPNEVDINKNGLEPDVKVEMDADDYENNRDPQLEKALELF